MMIIITAPSLDPLENVSGISSVAQLIIDNNLSQKYIHFQIGKTDGEKSVIKRAFRLLEMVYSWIRLISNKKDIIIHYNFPLSNFSIIRDSFLINIAVAFRKKMVVHIHGGLYLTKEEPPFIFNWILKYTLSRDFPIIVLSEKEKDVLQRRYNCNRIIVLPNCVKLENNSRPKISSDSIHQLDILFLGRISKDKGIDYILKSMLMLREKGYAFKLHFAGEEESKGEFIPLLKSQLGECFVYHGIVSGKSKGDLLRGMDVFLLPSFYEGLPMSLLESMSYSIVPVVTNVGSIGTVVKDRVNGLLIKDHDSQSIVDSIILLIENRNLRTRLSKNALQTIQDHFDIGNYVRQLNTIYQQIDER